MMRASPIFGAFHTTVLTAPQRSKGDPAYDRWLGLLSVNRAPGPVELLEGQTPPTLRKVFIPEQCFKTTSLDDALVWLFGPVTVDDLNAANILSHHFYDKSMEEMAFMVNFKLADTRDGNVFVGALSETGARKLLTTIYEVGHPGEDLGAAPAGELMAHLNSAALAAELEADARKEDEVEEEDVEPAAAPSAVLFPPPAEQTKFLRWKSTAPPAVQRQALVLEEGAPPARVVGGGEAALQDQQPQDDDVVFLEAPAAHPALPFGKLIEPGVYLLPQHAERGTAEDFKDAMYDVFVAPKLEPDYMQVVHSMSPTLVKAFTGTRASTYKFRPGTLSLYARNVPGEPRVMLVVCTGCCAELSIPYAKPGNTKFHSFCYKESRDAPREENCVGLLSYYLWTYIHKHFDAVWEESKTLLKRDKDAASGLPAPPPSPAAARAAAAARLRAERRQ